MPRAGAEDRPLEVAHPSPGPAELAVASEIRERILEGLSSLPEKYSLIMSMRYVEGLSYEDIGAALVLPVGTVKNRLFRARAALHRILGTVPGEGEEDGSRD